MKQEDFNTVKKKLTDYLVSKGLRMVPKRFIILEKIYSFDGHFSVECLHDYITKEGCEISLATLYNTIELFLDAKLVVKHQFCSGISVYERLVNNNSHHHFICNVCGRIQEFKDETIKTAIQTKRIAKFKQTSYSLCIYGVCSACSK
jgi:Fur family ferric uptake transcriptional regulator